MVGLAVGMLADHLPRRPAGAAAAPNSGDAASPAAPNPDRVRDYQDRLRALEAQAVQEEQAAAAQRTPDPHAGSAQPDPGEARPEDPIVAEKKRRRITRASSPATSS